MLERKVLKIVDVDGSAKKGISARTNKPYQVLKFRAIVEGWDADAVEISTLNPDFFPSLKADVKLDCDIETKTTEKDGNTWTNHNLTQIYIDGKPMTEKKAWAGGGYRGKSPEELIVERRSIERQTSLKLAVECWGLNTGEGKERDLFQVLIIADVFYKWISMGDMPKQPVVATPQPLEQVMGSLSSKTVTTPVSDEVVPQNLGELYTAVLKRFTPAQKRATSAKEYIAKLGITAEELKDISKAWKEIKVRAYWG